MTLSLVYWLWHNWNLRAVGKLLPNMIWLLWTVPRLFNSNLGPLIPSPAWYHWGESVFLPPPLFSAPTSESLSLCRSPATQTWTHFKASATGITSSSSPFPIFLSTGTWIRGWLSPGSCVWIHPFMKRGLALSKPSGIFPSFHLQPFHRWFWCVQACLMGTSPESLSQGPSPLHGRHETRITVSLLCRASPALIRLKRWRPIVLNVISLIKLLRPQFCGTHHC